jgi:hypothetical protein
VVSLLLYYVVSYPTHLLIVSADGTSNTSLTSAFVDVHAFPSFVCEATGSYHLPLVHFECRISHAEY